MKRFAASYLYTLADGATEPVRNGFVEMSESGEVLRTGVCDDPSAEPVFFEGALCPGFVNAHCHAELSYLKGKFLKGSGMAGFIDQINALRDCTSMEEKKRSIQEAMDLMYSRGVVAMADISNCSDSFDIKAAHPMYTRTFLEVFGDDPERCPEILEGVKALSREAEEKGLDAAPTPHACYTMSRRLLGEVSALGLRSGFLSYHSEESDEEQQMIRSGSGPMWDNRVLNGLRTPPVTGTSSLQYFIDTLSSAGVSLPVDGHMLLVHECEMDEEGVAAAKAAFSHPFIALCPLSNMFIHNSLPPVNMLRESGIPLCVGTDSLSSNDDLSILEELRCLELFFPSLSLGELLSWGSRNGALFLGKTALGELSEGKRPGLVLIDNLDSEGRLTHKSSSRLL